MALPAEGPQKERKVDLGGVTMSFILVPPGAFKMGTSNEEIGALLAKHPGLRREFLAGESPLHKVTISRSFYMGQHEVTVGQFRRFVEATGYKTDAERGVRFRGAGVYADGKKELAPGASWRNPYFKQADDHPVVCMSWNDSRKFAEWLNGVDKGKPAGWVYRLPTEAEWEYAARGPQSFIYPWGNTWDGHRCNFADKTSGIPEGDKATDDGCARTAPVGSFSPKGDSPFGICDMAGNVGEWCEDRHGPYAEPEQTDPVGPETGEHRVLRGGSWGDSPRLVRAAVRCRCYFDIRCDAYGFRLVLGPEAR